MKESDEGAFTEWVISNIKELQQASFYGKMILEFKDGKVVLLRREQTLKPPHVTD